ncbi:MAG: rod shape-determining protein MreC [Muribaculaceae bacterium]|nr:rod shape-determining protein MreC [Muribaculaceae bacterium]
MRNLLNFILRYSTWFVFTFYVVISIFLLVIGSRYRQSVYLTSANAVSGTIYDGTSQVTGYFNLRSINESLQASNAQLQNEVLNLKNEIAQYKMLLSDTAETFQSADRYGYVAASVINNNTRHPKNFFTINRGTLDGIEQGMGVMDQSGIVGIVNVAGPHMARVISLLNETQHFSVKIKDTSFVGSLNWKGGDATIAYMEEVPRHVKYEIGDTVVTSGYSTTFPEGIPVGIIMNRVRSQDDSFFTFKVHLLPDFRSLSTVRVIKDIYKEEIDSLATFDALINE